MIHKTILSEPNILLLADDVQIKTFYSLQIYLLHHEQFGINFLDTHHMMGQRRTEMQLTIDQLSFSKELFAILEETFETHQEIYLDKGTSLFATLNQISAIEASTPAGNGCATIAAQVEHIIFYLEVLARYIAGEDVGETAWGEIWDRVSSVTLSEWDEIRERLKVTYERVSKNLRSIENWDQNDAIGDSMAIVVHTAYHLGEIRQALCTFGKL